VATEVVEQPRGETEEKDPQQQAIEHGQGPCLVLAAPGSGKTYVVTQRFVRLIRAEGLEPHEILALAYNRRAADEMLGRVEKETGAIDGDPPLTTYHAWAYTVVRRFGWRAGWPSTFHIASGGQKSMYLADVLMELHPKALYDPARPFESVRNVNRLIERAKQELVTPSAYLDHVRQRLAEEPTGEEKLFWELHVDLARVYERLDEKYREEKLIDHDDAIGIVAKLLREDDEVREAYASIRYVMVDEFQDTNSAQAEMVEALVSVHRNVMVVADDDQAIYRFRGASRLNIGRFRDSFPERREIRLDVNRRSTPEIVALSQSVITQAPQREPKTIRAKRPSGAPVQVVWSRTYRDEVQAIVEGVQEHLIGGSDPRDIAVLTQFRADMEPVADGLRAAGIPYVLAQGRDLFRSMEIKGIMALLEAIRDPDASQALLRCLHLPAWQMSQEGRRYVLRSVNADDTPLVNRLRSGSIPDLSDEDRARGQLMALDLGELQAMALREDVRDVFEEAMIRTNYPALGDLANPLDRARFAGNVSRLYEILDEYCRIQKSAHFDDALRYLNLVRETGEESEASIDDDVDAVRVSTVHSAKGLEWSHVILCAAYQGRLPSPDRAAHFSLPATLVAGVTDNPGGHKEEQRRLFYVGLTRAKDTLTVTWAKRYPSVFKDKKATEFLPDHAKGLWVGREQQSSLLVIPQKRRLPSLLKDGKLVLSYSSIGDYRECPRRFEYRALWRMPPIFWPEGWYGERLHKVLFRLGQLRVGGKPVDGALVSEVWTAEWESAGDRGRVQGLRAQGLGMLQDYVASPLWEDAAIDVVEYSFRLPIGGDANWILTGTVDRIDIGPDGVPEVVDYKSGRPGDVDTVKGSLQLKIYARVAMEKYGLDAVDASLHWLQSAQSATVRWERRDIERFDYGLFKSFEGVESCMVNGHYPPRPNAYRCGQCQFRLICPERAEV
jgi:DNA helicase-2/ATP-dependent DNA helicase PcrA